MCSFSTRKAKIDFPAARFGLSPVCALRAVWGEGLLFILRKYPFKDIFKRVMVVKMKKIRVLLLSLVFGATFMLQAVPVHAQTDQKTVQCGDNQVAVGVSINGNNCINKGTKLEDNVIVVWLSMIIKFLTVGVGLAAVGGVVYGGFLYLTAQGNSGKTQKGVTTIMNALVGVLLYALTFAIVNFIIPGGVLK